MSYGNVRHPHAVWIDRAHAALRLVPKVGVLGIGGVIINAGVTYNLFGVIMIGAAYCGAAILLWCRK